MKNSHNKKYLFILLTLILPFVNFKGVDAESFPSGKTNVCKIVAATTQLSFCNKEGCSNYVTNMTADKNRYNYVKQRVSCPTGYELDTLDNGIQVCVQNKEACTKEQLHDASKVIYADCNGGDATYDYSVGFTKILSPDNCQSDEFCMSYGYYAYVDGPLVVEVTAEEKHKVFFSTPPTSLVEASKGTQFAPGTGVEFVIEYDQDIDWNTIVSCPAQYEYHEKKTHDKTENACGPCAGGPPSPSPPGPVPQTGIPVPDTGSCGSDGMVENYALCQAQEQGMIPAWYASYAYHRGEEPQTEQEAFNRYLNFMDHLYGSKAQITPSAQQDGSGCLEYSVETRNYTRSCVIRYEECGCDENGDNCYWRPVYGTMQCAEFKYYCHTCERTQCGPHSECSASVPTITTPEVESEVTVTTQTTKGEDVQGLGSFEADENNIKSKTAWSGSIRNKYVFTNPKVFIHVKTGEICYQTKAYGKGLWHKLDEKTINNTCGDVSSDLWQEVTSGYYIPVTAIPETESVIEANISNMGYIVTLFGQTKQLDLSANLICEFEVKIPGCPVQECGDEYCNPNTDEYKCCRNSAYLEQHPEYYGKACTGDGYLFRQISLTQPFPGREAGTNWMYWISEVENKEELENSYEELEYSVSLTPELIKAIRNYNDKEDNKYTSWVKINDNGSSKFLTGTVDEYSFNFNGTIKNDEYYKLGCGPSNADWSWCQQ